MIARWIDERLRVSKFADSVLNHVFPDNWSFLLGEIAMYCFVILVATGLYLTFFFHPGSRATWSTAGAMSPCAAFTCRRHMSRPSC